VTAREILDKASKDINTGLAKDPELQAQMLHVMGRAYMNLGFFLTRNRCSKGVSKRAHPSLGKRIAKH
jgi:hypothetical protein